MPNPPRRPFFQIHLSTAIVLMFTAGALMWANIVARSNTKLMSEPSETRRNYWCLNEYGWPLSIKKYIVGEIINGRKDAHYMGEVGYNDFVLALPADVFVAIIILGIAWYLCEWLTRPRAARKGA